MSDVKLSYFALNQTRLPNHALLAALALAVGICVSTYVVQDARHDSHATLYYLVLLHLAVLPQLLLYWRKNSALGPSEFRLPPIHWIAVLVFAGVAVAAGKTAEHGKMISDESSYMFQARIFAARKLKAEPMLFGVGNISPDRIEREVPEIYFENTVQTTSGFFCKYPPGWPLILAVGYLVKCPWLVNPVLGLLQLMLTWVLARAWTRNTQILAILIAASSPYMFISSVGFMPHAAEASICLSALFCLLKGVREKRMGWIILCFSLVAASTLVRPYTGAVLGLVCTAISIHGLWSQRRLLLGLLIIVAAGGAFAIAGFLMVNWLFTGDAFLSPYALFRGQRHISELTLNPLQISHNIISIWRWAVMDTVRVTFPFMFLFALYGVWNERKNRNELVYLALAFPALVAAYALQSEPSASFDGERYYFEGFCAIAIVAARGFELFLSDRKVSLTKAASAGIPLLILQATLLLFTIRDVETVLKPYRESYELALSDPPASLVFISGNAPRFFQAKHLNWNQADWRASSTIYLIDPGSDRRVEVSCRFGRHSYRLVQYDATSNKLAKADTSVNCTGPP